MKHSFRPGKQEAGLMDFEGWNDVGLVRHLTLALIVPGFVTLHTERLRGEDPGVGGGAGLPGVEPSPAVRQSFGDGGASRRPGTQAKSSVITSGVTRPPPRLTINGRINDSHESRSVLPTRSPSEAFVSRRTKRRQQRSTMINQQFAIINESGRLFSPDAGWPMWNESPPVPGRRARTARDCGRWPRRPG